MFKPIYQDQEPCQKEGCQRKARYKVNQGRMLVCGNHSKKYDPIDKFQLPPAPRSPLLGIRKKLQAQLSSSKKGEVSFAELSGYQRVNVKQFDPVHLGPFQLPSGEKCVSLQAFMIGSWSSTDNLTDKYWEQRALAFLGVTENEPDEKFFVWVNEDRTVEVYPSELKAQQFFCVYFKKLVEQKKEFIQLKKSKTNGCNLYIPCKASKPIDLLDDLFEKQPQVFTYELVLYCLLTDQEPWKKFVTHSFH